MDDLEEHIKERQQKSTGFKYLFDIAMKRRTANKKNKSWNFVDYIYTKKYKIQDKLFYLGVAMAIIAFVVFAVYYVGKDKKKSQSQSKSSSSTP